MTANFCDGMKIVMILHIYLQAGNEKPSNIMLNILRKNIYLL